MSWHDRVPRVEILRRAGLSSLECVAAKNELRCSTMYVVCLTAVTLRKCYTGNGPKKRFKDHLKKTLKSFEILPSNIEREATDRAGWRAACAAGATRFEDQRTQSRETRRARRHDARDKAHEPNLSRVRAEVPVAHRPFQPHEGPSTGISDGTSCHRRQRWTTLSK